MANGWLTGFSEAFVASEGMVGGVERNMMASHELMLIPVSENRVPTIEWMRASPRGPQ